MKASLKEIKNRYREGRYKEALALIETIEREGLLHPEVLVWKGRCIQLDDERTAYELSDAEQAYKQALSIDNEFTPAIVELAYLYLNVLDDAKQANTLFKKAVHSYKMLMTEAVVGLAKSIAEVKSKEAALRYLLTISTSLLDRSEIEEARKDIESLG